MKQQLHLQTELSVIVYNWLITAGNKINKDYCTQEITTHADYPAVTAVVDFLDAGNMAYQAVQADASYIHEFNYPLLAHIKMPGNEYLHIIQNATAWDAQKETTKYWSGITIFPEKNAYWQNEENNIATATAQKQTYLFTAWCGIGLLLFLASIYYSPLLWYNIFGFLGLAGVFISAAAFATELGIQSNTVKQVCGAVSKGGCEAVLKSKIAKGAFGITPSDIAVIYFAAQFTIYLAAAFFPNVFSILPYMALAGIAIIGTSIYTQAVVIKQWCALCLSIAGILLLQVLTALFLLGSISIVSFITFGAAALFFTAALLPIKKLLKSYVATKPKLTELKKWQSDPNIFLAQLEKEQTVDISIWENDLVIGNPNAPIMITVACNPYCGPCAKAHQELDHILKIFEGRVKVQLRFLCKATDDNHLTTIALKSMLEQSDILKINSDLHTMFIDWFHWMDIIRWRKKWNKVSTKNVKDQLVKHDNWVRESNITYTPTFFINGKKLPSKYNLKTIKKIIPQLAHKSKIV